MIRDARPDMTEVMLFGLPTAVIGLTITVVGCRHQCARRCLPSASVSFFSTFAALALMLLMLYQGELFEWRAWTESAREAKVPLLLMIPIFVLICAPFGLIPSLVVVWFYRRHFRNHAPVV